MEDLPSVIEKVKAFARQNLPVVLLFSAGIVLLLIGLIQFFGQQKASVDFKSGEHVARESGSSSQIFVDVSGQVMKPGVYGLKGDARIQEALVAAGGLSSDADREYVSKYMNLAQKVTDGMKLYVPKVSENMKGSAIAGTNQTGLVSINSGSLSDLDKLSGVGPVTAQRIIDGRPYASLDELVSKKAINSSVFTKIKDSISL